MGGTIAIQDFFPEKNSFTTSFHLVRIRELAVVAVGLHKIPLVAAGMRAAIARGSLAPRRDARNGCSHPPLRRSPPITVPNVVVGTRLAAASPSMHGVATIARASASDYGGSAQPPHPRLCADSPGCPRDVVDDPACDTAAAVSTSSGCLPRRSLLAAALALASSAVALGGGPRPAVAADPEGGEGTSVPPLGGSRDSPEVRAAIDAALKGNVAKAKVRPPRIRPLCVKWPPCCDTGPARRPNHKRLDPPLGWGAPFVPDVWRAHSSSIMGLL